MALRLRRGTDAQRLTLDGVSIPVPAEGEIIYTTDTKKLYVGDGTTVGGIAVDVANSDLNIDDLIDVDTTSAGHIPNDGEALVWDQGMSHWMPGDATILSDKSINALQDVDTISNTPTVGQVLKYDGAGWVNGTDVSGGLIDGATYPINITGDVTGSVFGDDSSKIIDGTDGTITTSKISAALNLDLVTLSTDEVRATTSNVRILSQTTGSNSQDGPAFASDTSRGTLAAPVAVNNGDAILSLLATAYTGSAYQTKGLFTFNISDNTVGTEAKPGRLDISVLDDNGAYDNGFARLESNGIFTVRAIQSLGITTTDKTGLLAKVSGGIGLQGTIVYDTTLAGLSYYHGADGWNNVLTGNKPVETTSFIKPGVYADDAARDAAIPTPTAGMMVFNTTGTKFQGYTGSAWVDLN